MKRVYFLLDRSGSMATNWTETIGSINGYVSKLEPNTMVHLTAFDNVSHDLVQEALAGNWTMIDDKEVYPRGSTPLYDSAAKLMDAMITDAPTDGAVLVIMTDGEENSSKEYKLDAVKAKLKMLEDRGWPTVYLGAEFKEVVAYATGTFNIAASNVVSTNSVSRIATMNMLAAKTESYFNEVVQFNDAGGVGTFTSTSMAFTDQEKDILNKEAAKKHAKAVKRPVGATTT